MLNYLNSGNFDFDIISFGLNVDHTTLNLIKKVNFSLVCNIIMIYSFKNYFFFYLIQSISKGIGIEINYSSCLSSSAQRRQAIAFGQLMVAKANSKVKILNLKILIQFIFVLILFIRI